MKIEWIEKCKDCKGTGVYVGFLEQNSDYGVICSSCKGTGTKFREFEYEEFQGKETANVNYVLETNPGIMIGKSYDMGGISYDEWKQGQKFSVGSEMRKDTCPAWWFQYADYDKKPRWKECWFPGTFSSCQYFPTKHKCWERWDKENKNE